MKDLQEALSGTDGATSPRVGGNVERIDPCVDIEYPFTEDGKPACLSRACPKNNSCKWCCKDWSKK